MGRLFIQIRNRLNCECSFLRGRRTAHKATPSSRGLLSREQPLYATLKDRRGELKVACNKFL